MPVRLGDRLHPGDGRLPRRQVPLAELTLEGGIREHEKAPGLAIAATGRADGGMQHRLHRLVGDGLRAEMADCPLTVDGIEERYGFVGHGNLLPRLSRADACATQRSAVFLRAARAVSRIPSVYRERSWCCCSVWLLRPGA